MAVSGNFGPEALELNRRLVEANPADLASRTRLARCYLEAGRLEEAEAHYREVLRIDVRNRIAAGGLEMVAMQRHPIDVESAGARRAPRARRPRSEAPVRTVDLAASVSLGPVPQTFAGFAAAEFDELASCSRQDIQERFAPRVLDLLRRVNALPSSTEIAEIREAGKRRLFRTARGDVHTARAHWHAFSLGGRSEPHFDIGMYAGSEPGNWFRAGMAFNLTEQAAEAEEDATEDVRQHFRRFQEILGSPRRSLFLGWMVKENGFVEHAGRGPRLDVHEPSQAAALITGCDPERVGWLFFGKWLSPDQPDSSPTLADPVNLVRTIDRVFAGLTPLWRAMWE